MTASIQSGSPIDPKALQLLQALAQQASAQTASSAGATSESKAPVDIDIGALATALQAFLGGAECAPAARVWLEKAKPLGCEMTRAVAVGETMFAHDPHLGLVSYDAKADVWTNHGYPQFAALRHDKAVMQSGLGLHEGKIIVAGGNAGSTCQPRTIAGIAAYDPKTGAFDELPVKQGALLPRAGQAIAGEGDRIYLFGGGEFPRKNNGIQRYVPGGTRSVQVYDTEHCTVKTLSEMHRGRAEAGAITVGDKMYVVGGQRQTGSSYEVYDFKKDQWAGPFDLPFEVMNPSLRVEDGKLHVEGGQNVRSVGSSKCLLANERTCSIDLESGAVCLQTSLPVGRDSKAVAVTLDNGDKVVAAYGGRKVRTEVLTHPETDRGFDNLSIHNAFNVTANVDNSVTKLVTLNEYNTTFNETHHHRVKIDMSTVNNHSTHNDITVNKEIDLSLLRFGKAPGGHGHVGKGGWFCRLFGANKKPRTGVRGEGAQREVFGQQVGGQGPLPKNRECFAFHPETNQLFGFQTDKDGCFNLPVGPNVTGKLHVFSMQDGKPTGAATIAIP